MIKYSILYEYASITRNLNVFCLFMKAMYMFYALALVCDDYFVPSLEKICEVNTHFVLMMYI